MPIQTRTSPLKFDHFVENFGVKYGIVSFNLAEDGASRLRVPRGEIRESSRLRLRARKNRERQRELRGPDARARTLADEVERSQRVDRGGGLRGPKKTRTNI